MPRLIFASATMEGFRGIGATMYAATTVRMTMAMNLVRVSWPISSPEYETLESVHVRPVPGEGSLCSGLALLFLSLGLRLGDAFKARDRRLAHPDADVVLLVDANGDV